MKLGLSVALAALFVGACGSGGDDAETTATSPSAGATETSAGGPESPLFKAKQVGFTFRYPRGFTATTKARDQVLGQVSLEPDARLNAIKVRETADRELKPDRYLDEFRRDFSRSVGNVDERREKVGDLDTGVLQFDDTADLHGEKVGFSSTSYFFAGAGRTWQVECIADEQHADEIADACRDALESVEFTKSG